MFPGMPTMFFKIHINTTKDVKKKKNVLSYNFAQVCHFSITSSFTDIHSKNVCFRTIFHSFKCN